MPFLESVTLTEEADGKKYVFWKNKIYFASDFESDEHHADLVKAAAQELGIGIRDIERENINSKPIVEAAGTITSINGKFDFSVSTSTCKIIYSANEALNRVKTHAREIVGVENVN